jgi:hypothetical protein
MAGAKKKGSKVSFWKIMNAGVLLRERLAWMLAALLLFYYIDDLFVAPSSCGAKGDIAAEIGWHIAAGLVAMVVMIMAFFMANKLDEAYGDTLFGNKLVKK